MPLCCKTRCPSSGPTTMFSPSAIGAGMYPSCPAWAMPSPPAASCTSGFLTQGLPRVGGWAGRAVQQVASAWPSGLMGCSSVPQTATRQLRPVPSPTQRPHRTRCASTGAVLREWWHYGPGDAERALHSQNPCASTGTWFLEPTPVVRSSLQLSLWRQQPHACCELAGALGWEWRGGAAA